MNKYYVNSNVTKGHIRKELQGHFSEHLGRCIYGGLYVGEDADIPNVDGMRTDVVEALKAVRIPVLRWPGGCFADEYHWKDGIGPKQNRKKMVNTHWGGVTEDNSFGTHEFMELCRQLDCQPYVNGNVGSGTVQEMSEWVEYMTFSGISPMADLRRKNGHAEAWQVPYFGVGNENWGCGGNMTPEYYANEFRRYQTYVRNYDPDKKIYKIACGPNAADYEWTESVMRIAGNYMDGLSLHYYTVPYDWNSRGHALEFSAQDYYETIEKALLLDELITRHGAIMDRYDPDRRVGLIVDEWGTWYDVEEGTNPGFLYQQNSMRDAIVAALSLNIFNKHCSRVHMANLAQTVNVLQSLILTEGERMLLTPTYHVFAMYQHHQENELADSHLEEDIRCAGNARIPVLQESASVSPDGTVHITMVNLSLEESREIETVLTDRTIEAVKGEILTDKMDAHNTFDAPDAVKAREFSDFWRTESGLAFTIPPCSVVHLEIR
ncbi:MAG: alpha-L-arabinofuranosidase C-terminal domain-containing protein [Eubacteriales bacterium]|nr:alpha-L-arabinofuranosidase C-terminal domain-containing protein [Eubacteriales bacterium]